MRDEVSIPAFKLDHTGLARLFGELEAQVMEIVWQLDEATVNDVLIRLSDEHHYNTVMTVMSRLADKGILVRRREGRAHIYEPVEDRDTFLARVSREVAEGLLREFGAVAIAQFVDAADAVDPELLAELRRRVQEKAGSDDY
ncbi:MAG: BlaI/MecI/CopY family transcriptional regulator [Anaerolineae bacterium]